MSDDKQLLPSDFNERLGLTIPAFETRPEVVMDFSKIREGEKRIYEARTVNPATYNELEFTMNEGYREAKANLIVVGYELMQANKIIRQIKSEYLLDEYPTFLKENKIKDNTAMREAFLERQPRYVEANDRLMMLQAMEGSLEGKIKVFENVCRYMKKTMDILIRSGSIDSNKY